MTSAVAWSWRNALHGAVLGLPAGAAMLSDPQIGLALAVGVLPAAGLGVTSSRRQRAMSLVVGVIAAVLAFEEPWGVTSPGKGDRAGSVSHLALVRGQFRMRGGPGRCSFDPA